MSSAGKCASIDVNQKVGGGELGGGCASFLPSWNICLILMICLILIINIFLSVSLHFFDLDAVL